MVTYTRYMDSTDTSKGLSPSVWGDCPSREELLTGPRAGFEFFDDFLFFPSTVIDATTIVDMDGGMPYAAFNSSGGTQTADNSLGGAIVLTEATDGESVAIFTEQHCFGFAGDDAQGGDFWFEARIKLGNIVTNATSWLIGLMDTTQVTAAVPLTTAGVTADINYVGFMKPEVDTTTFNQSYRADGVTEVEVNGGIGLPTGTLAADTYFKVGFKIIDNILSGYVDGAKQTSTKVLPTTSDGADFPDDVLLKPVMALAVGAGAGTDTLTCDWWRFVQLRD